MRKAWKRLGAFILRLLGQQEVVLKLGIKTQFRGRKNTLHQHEWQAIAEIFTRIPDLEDYLRMQLEEVETFLRTTPITEDGDRRRLVLQSQAEVLQDMLALPEKAAAKAQAMLRPKSVKGNTHVHP